MTNAPPPRDLTLDPSLEPTLALLLAAMNNATATWRNEMGSDGLDEAALVWQPAPGLHSVGALMLHIADVEEDWIQQVGAGRARTPERKRQLLSDETQQDSVSWPAAPRQPLAWYFDLQDQARRATRDTLRALADPLHAGRGDDGEAFTLRWIMNHVAAHEMYHGGQAVLLSLLARRLG